MSHPKMTRRELRGAIVGMTMGDGWLIQNRFRDGSYRGNYILGVAHCSEQLRYLEWKRDLVNQLFEYPLPINFRNIVHKNTGKEYPSYRFVTRVHSRLSFIAKNIYLNKQKRITEWALSNLTDLGLAIWWMDDGCLHFDPRENHGGGNLIFGLYGFPKEDVEKFSAWLFEKYGVSFRAYQHKSGGWYLKRGISEGWKILDKLIPFSHESMKRKFEWKKSITRIAGPYCLSPSYLTVPAIPSQQGMMI